MKKLFILHLLLINVFISPLYAENMLTKVRDYFYTTRLFAGYHSSPAEKAAAREKIKQLSTERDNLQNSLEMIIDDEQEEQAIRTKIAEINKQIYEQKIILGQEWTKERRRYWAGAGFLGLAALGGTELWLKGTQSYAFKYGLPTKIQTEQLLHKYSDKPKSRLIKRINEIDEEIEKINEKYQTVTKKEIKEINELDRQMNALKSEQEELITVGTARGYTEEEMRKK